MDGRPKNYRTIGNVKLGSSLMRKKTYLIGLFLLGLTFGAIADEPKPLPNFNLVDQEGRDFELAALKGKYVLLSFVFTRCPMPEMCPLTITRSKELIERWRAEPAWKREGFPIHLLFLTLDPAYDTPQVMKAYMENQRLDPALVTFATGKPEVLAELGSFFNILAMPSGDTISHNMKSILLSPLHVPIREFKDNAWTPDEILELTRKSVAWWIWFFVGSAFLAIPGLVMIRVIRKKYGLELNTPN